MHEKEENISRALRIAAPPILVLLSLICGAAAILAASLGAPNADTDPISHYFADTWARAALCIIIPISLILPMILPALLKDEPQKETDTVSAIFSMITGIGAVGVSAYIILKGLGFEGVEWEIAFSAFALVAAAFFILKPLKCSATAKVLTSFGPIALGVATIALLYFDFEIELNSHYKLATQFGAVGLMLGTFADVRAVMSRIKLGWSLLLRSLSLTLTLIPAGAVIAAFIIGSIALPAYYLVFAIFFMLYALTSVCELISVSLREFKA